MSDLSDLMNTLLSRFHRLLPLAGSAERLSSPAVAGQCAVAHAVIDGKECMLATARTRKLLIEGLAGEIFSSPDGFIVKAECSHDTAEALRHALPWCGAQVLDAEELTVFESISELIAYGKPGALAYRGEDFADELAFEVIRNHFDCGFALIGNAVSPNVSLYMAEWPETKCTPEPDLHYRNTTWILDEEHAVIFEPELLALYQKKYAGLPAELKKLAGKIRECRKEDFQIIIRPGETTGELLYLVRELYRHGNSHVSILLPEQGIPLWQKVLQYGDCSFIHIGRF